MTTTRQRRWLGPAIALVALVGSLSLLAYTLTHRGAGPPDEAPLRLSVAVGPDAMASADAAVRSIPGRALAGAAVVTVKEQTRATIDRMLAMNSAPTVVKYAVQQGTLEDVANMFGIFHHEMIEMNPGVGLKDGLVSGTRVVVYDRLQAGASASIGEASSGSLKGAVPMIEGPGRILRKHRLKTWALSSTVTRLDWVLKQWAIRYPDAHPILVGNLSLRRGGKVKPHKSHQSGRDADISYIQVWDGVSEPKWQKMGAHNLDLDRTWNLLELLRETDAISVIYIDHAIQKLLYEHAIATDRFSAEALTIWMQYPQGPTTEGPVIQHAPGHVDHIHVRFTCPAGDSQCVN